jgi:hypothetical protein
MLKSMDEHRIPKRVPEMKMGGKKDTGADHKHGG